MMGNIYYSRVLVFLRKPIALLFFTLLIFLYSCGSKDEFTVEGNLSHTTSNKIYLAEVQSNGVIPIDTAILAKDGKFSFHLKIEKPRVLEVLTEGFSMDVVAEKGRTVFFQADLRDTAMNYSIYGSEENKKLQEFNHSRQQAAKGVNLLVEDLKKAKTTEDTARIYARNTQIEANLYQKIRDFTLKHKNDFVALYAVNFLSSDKDYPLFKEVAASAGSHFKGNPLADSLQNFIMREKPTAVGEQGQIINLPGPDGKFHSLTELRGKYVMIDFWASWCGPCRRENPMNVKIYQEFKNKGFTIFGVSLDRNKTEWLKAIKDDDLVWTQVSELKEWHSEVVSTYNFQGIPFNVILDKNGKILAKNLHGEELEDYLKKLLL